MARLEMHQKKPIPKGLIITGLIFSLLLIVSSILWIYYPFASQQKETYFSGENPILFQGKQAGNAIIEGDTVYLPFEFLQTIDDSITFDSQSNSFIITTKDKVIQMPSESLTYFINEKPVELHVPAITSKDNKYYLAIEQLLPYYPIQYKVLEESNAVWVQENGLELKEGQIIDQEVHNELLRLRTNPDLKAAYTAKASSGEKIYIEGDSADFYYVRKLSGEAGFIEKEFVKVEGSTKVAVSHEQQQPVLPKIEGPIQLTWEAVYSKNPDHSKIPVMEGVNVVSPTWFKLGAEDGTVDNLGSLEYSNWAKSRGYQVWGLFSNDFDPDLTHAAFKNFETRQTVIRQLLHFSKMYKLEGINIDIENVRPEDGPLVTQFVREATPYFHEAGLIVSMDITFISNNGNWSVFYEREKLSEIVDYLVVMAYDEHWGTSPVAGSVASLPWVEKNLQTLLEIVPSEKLILGVPLYARLWKEEIDETGNKKVSSKALSMEKVDQWIEENQVKPVYDPVSGQNYAEHYSEAEKATYKIWLEDPLSLKKRADLAKKYELAGLASWSRYFADETAWTALNLKTDQNVTQNN